MNIPHRYGSPSSHYASRRAFLQRAGAGFGMLALTDLLDRQGLLTTAAEAAADDRALHPLALFQINSGLPRMGFPSVGAWVTYGLGSENQNLPGFVVMYDTLGRGLPKGYAQNWGAGFLPGIYQGTALNPRGAPIDNLYRSTHM